MQEPEQYFQVPEGAVQIHLDRLPVWDSAHLYVSEEAARQGYRDPEPHERAIAWLGPSAAQAPIGADFDKARTPQQMLSYNPVMVAPHHEPSMIDVFTMLFAALTLGRKSRLTRPTAILPGVFQNMVDEPVKFPVCVRYPGFGMGRVFRSFCLRQERGYGDVLLYYAVKKLTPDATYQGREPFTGAYYAVPLGMATRVRLAVEQISLEPSPGGMVQLIDDTGAQYDPMDLGTFRGTRSPEYELARRNLTDQYPASVWTDLFASKPINMIPVPQAGLQAFPAATLQAAKEAAAAEAAPAEAAPDE